MKVRYFLFIIFIAVIGGMAFTSCGDDDDNDSKKTIEGAWESEELNYEEHKDTGGKVEYITYTIRYYYFAKDHKAYFVSQDFENKFKKGAPVLKEGTWTLKDKDLTLTWEDNSKDDYTAVISTNQMLWNGEGKAFLLYRTNTTTVMNYFEE